MNYRRLDPHLNPFLAYRQHDRRRAIAQLGWAALLALCVLAAAYVEARP